MEPGIQSTSLGWVAQSSNDAGDENLSDTLRTTICGEVASTLTLTSDSSGSGVWLGRDASDAREEEDDDDADDADDADDVSSRAAAARGVWFC